AAASRARGSICCGGSGARRRRATLPSSWWATTSAWRTTALSRRPSARACASPARVPTSRPSWRRPTSPACPRARKPSATSSSKPAPRASRSSPPAAPAPPSCSRARSPPWSWTTRRIWSRSRARWLTPSAPSTTPSREPPARAPRTSPGTGTSMASKHCWRRSPVADSAPAAPARRDPATAEPRYLRSGRLRAWVAPGVDLEHAIAADGDPDHLLTRPDCRIVKLQRKVVVGRVEPAAGALWVKRYAVFAWRVALASLWRTSPAFGAWAGARALAAHGFVTPEPIAAIEFRRAGLLRRSFFVTREVAGAVTADVRWRSILADPDARRRRAARRALACALGDLFRRLHAEAHTVPCLESVTWCDEIVVVDGGSRDRTAALARRFTDRVLVNPWPGYRAQKQYALDAARGAWVLNLDADERVSPELVDEIRAVLAHVPARVAGFA